MKVFVSHITEESPLAQVIKEWVETSFPGYLEVFVSSDIHDVPAGIKWRREIEAALEASQIFLVLCSPSSLPRPWINLETGCAWIKKIPIIPLCHSGQEKGLLPPRISEFQALLIDDPEFIDDLILSLSKALGISKFPRIDKERMKSEISTAIQMIVVQQRKQIDHEPTRRLQEIDPIALEIRITLGNGDGVTLHYLLRNILLRRQELNTI
jgi:hypothetical protein